MWGRQGVGTGVAWNVGAGVLVSCDHVGDNIHVVGPKEVTVSLRCWWTSRMTGRCTRSGRKAQSAESAICIRCPMDDIDNSLSHIHSSIKKNHFHNDWLPKSSLDLLKISSRIRRHELSSELQFLLRPNMVT